jgi:hypothetical protein
MNEHKTELVFVLDRSGSMHHLVSDTIGGYNALLEKQKSEPGACLLTTVLFDDRYELLHDRVPLDSIRPMTEHEYYARGNTALLDAIGSTIAKTASALCGTSEEQRAKKVLFVIVTDGLENASREYSAARVREMVSQKQAQDGWEFLFLGANMDAISVAAQVGIQADRAATYRADRVGTSLNYDVLSDAVGSVRAGAPIGAQWKQRIQEDSKRTRKDR